MLKNLSCIAVMAFLCALCITEISAQAKEKSHKVIIVEKQVGENGQMTETVTVKDGADAKAFIDNMDVDGDNIWISDKGDTTIIDGATAGMIKKEAYKVEILDENGKSKIIEWDGEGEMPQEIKEVLNEGDVAKGLKRNNIMIKKKKDGEEEIMNYEYDGEELPQEVQDLLDKEGIDINELINEKGEKEIRVIKKNNNDRDSKKALLGVNIDTHQDGARISNVVKNSAAEEAGLQVADVITAVDDKPIKDIESLVSTIASYRPNDIVIVNFTRDGVEKSTEVRLKEKVEPFKFKTWEEVMNSGKEKEIRIEKEIIIEKGK